MSVIVSKNIGKSNGYSAETKNRRFTPPSMMEFIAKKTGIKKFDVDMAAEPDSHHSSMYIGDPKQFSMVIDQAFGGLGMHHPGCPALAVPGGVCYICKKQMPFTLDGLNKQWIKLYASMKPAFSVFLNPPFEDLHLWFSMVWNVMRAVKDPCAGGKRGIHQAVVVIPCNRTEQGFWQSMIEPYRDRDGFELFDDEKFMYKLKTFYPPERTHYGNPEHPNGDEDGESPNFASCVLFFQAFALE